MMLSTSPDIPHFVRGTAGVGMFSRQLSAALARLVTMLYLILGTMPATSTVTSLPSPSADEASRIERCRSRQKYGHPDGCGQCSNVISNFPVEARQTSWFIAATFDRSSDSFLSGRRNLRGGNRSGRLHRRSLPHEYFMTVMEATLSAIKDMEQDAVVHIAIFTDGRRDGLADGTSVPPEWDFSGEICEEMALSCTQSLVLLSRPKTNIPEAIECAASADIFVSSESEFSHATAMVSKNVRVLTDRWNPEEEEMMMTLEPATTVAGMGGNRAKLGSIIREYRECIMDST